MNDKNRHNTPAPNSVSDINDDLWGQMTPKERNNALQNIENNAAKEEHRTPAKIKGNNVFNNKTGYNSFDHTITVDNKNKSFNRDNFINAQNEASKNINAPEAAGRRFKAEYSKPKLKHSENRTVGIYSGKEYSTASTFDANLGEFSVKKNNAFKNGAIIMAS